VKGKVDVWNNHPLTRDEAVAVLDSALNRNGYAAIRNGRTLTIMSRDDAKKRNIPVMPGSNPEAIPKTMKWSRKLSRSVMPTSPVA